VPVIKIDDLAYKVVDYVARAEGTDKRRVASNIIKDHVENNEYYQRMYKRIEEAEEEDRLDFED